MDVMLIYFSQTGNTRKVTNAMAAAFREAGHSTATLSLKEATPVDANWGDLLGIGSPCFSSQAPTPIKKFLHATPPLNGLRSFVFATSGGAPGKVLYDLSSLLQRKGSEVLGGLLVRGQVNHPAPYMIGQFPGRPNEGDLTLVRRFAAEISQHTSTNTYGPLQRGTRSALKHGRGFYILMGMIISDKLLRLLLPEPKLDPAKCDRCLWCVRECPMENRNLTSSPILGDQCIRCYRCLSGCPQKAFEVNWHFADPFLAFLYNTRFMRLFGDVKPGEPIH